MERRLSKRWEHVGDVFCYINGVRFDAKSEDVSAGGMFLATPINVPKGTKVAMVFRDQGDLDLPPVFLIGIVMRIQTGEHLGLGLAWETAITEGPDLSLRYFLNRVLKLDGEINRRLTPKGVSKAVFSFLPPGKPSPIENLEQESGEPAAEELIKERSIKGDGPLTKIVQKAQDWVHCGLAVKLDSSHGELSGKIEMMGRKRMYVHLKSVPLELKEELTATLTLTTARGDRLIKISCRVENVICTSPGGVGAVELEYWAYIDDDKESEGIFARYIRWLYFRAYSLRNS
jgi:PilZ domain